MSKFEEEIAMLENALKGALLVPSECTFVSSEVIKTCLDTLKTYESWEYLIEHEIEEKIRLDERTKVLDEVIKALGNDYWNIAKIQGLKEQKC